MKTKTSPKTIRRSVALPSRPVEEATAKAPRDLRENFNCLVIVALQEFVARQTTRTLEDALAHMAVDPAIRPECAAIGRHFTVAEADGLKDD